MREKWKSVADCRFQIFPARSTRMKKNGTPRVGALQRRQAVAGGFKAYAIAARDQVDVITHRFGGVQEIALEISPSYLNQIERNQRSLTVPVLLRLNAAFGLDVQLFPMALRAG